MQSTDSHLRTGPAAGFAAATIWGGMYVVSKIVLEVIPPFALLSSRLLLGFLALFIWQMRSGGMPRLSRKQWGQLLGLGVLGYGISLGFQFVGTRLSTASNGAVVTAATPAFIYIFAFLLLGEKIGPRRFLALVLSMLGVLAVIDPWRAGLDPDMWQGSLILLGAAITWALYSVLVRQISRSLAVLPLTVIAFLGGIIVALPLGLREWAAVDIASLDAGIVAGVLYLGLASTALAAWLWNKAFELLEAGLASLTFFAQPVVGAGLGVLLLGETLSPLFLAGGAFVLVGIYLAASDDKIETSS